jgi:NADPH-dependent 2,4-dienoyl-CoA reductase/sulfur reductase-like enzyme
MPYYIGDVIKDERSLIARTPEQFKKSGIDVLLKTRAEQVDHEARIVRLSTGATLPYDHLVVATGAQAVMPGIPGQDLPGVFTLRTLQDAVRMKSCIREKDCRKAAILGAGFIAMEMSEALSNLGMEVELIQRDTVAIKRWAPELVEVVLRTFAEKRIAFHVDTRATSIEMVDGGKLRIVTDRGNIETDLVLIAIGIRPDVNMAKELGLAIGDSGAVRVNAAQQTSVEGIYSVGDCCEVYHRVARRPLYFPLGDIANKQGRIAGRNIGGRPAVFPGIVGAQSFKFFDLELAATGLSEEEATRYGFSPAAAIAWGPPVARLMASEEDGETGLKLIADRSTGLLLGAQAVGRKDPVKKINALSVALWYGARLDEPAFMDFAYSPPFGGPWDLIHITAQLLLRTL